ncbi:MAG: serine/threonine-protein kinase [Nannocystaceae bacterium]
MEQVEVTDTDEAGPTSPARPAMPTVLGRFRVLRQTGSGGMGVVYVAYDPELDRKVAVKLLHPSVRSSARGEVAGARLIREAKALARLSHPNVVAVHDVGTHQGQVFIAMEFIEGVSLGTWLRGQKRSRREILQVFAAAGRGLAAAHREGLVHGDFKPDNVLVDPSGRVRVVDFGLAFAQDRSKPTTKARPSQLEIAVDTRLTPAGTMTGTPAYLSPEQFHGAPGSALADQFSFCVSLYEGLYGVRPFPGDDLRAIRASVERGLPPEPRERSQPAWIRRILVRGLGDDPGERYPSMDELVADLERDPARRRARIGVAATIVIALIAAALAYRWVLLRDLHARQGLCASATEELAGVWDDAQRAAAERAFLATDLPYAADAWARVAAGLDAHTGAWVAMRVEACEATHLHGDQSEALLDRRVLCLRERLTAVRSLVEVLVDADAGVVENAAQAIASLPDLAPCGDAAALLAVDAPAIPREVADEVLAIRSELAQARALVATARYHSAAALAEDAWRRSLPLADRALTAEARLAHVEALEGLGSPDMVEALDDAFFTAESTHDDEILARIALSELYTTTTRLELAAAERWAKHARALLDRLGDTPSLLRDTLESELSSSLGTLHLHAGRLDQAEAAYRDAIARTTRLPGDHDLRIAGMHNNLGNLLVRRGELDRAAIDLDRAAALYREVLGPHHPLVAIALNNRGELAMRRGAPDEARVSYDRARAILVAAVGPSHPHVGVLDNNLGYLALSLGDPVAATERFRRAQGVFEAAFGPEAPPLAYPLTGLGEALLAEGQVDDARETLELALRLRDQGIPNDVARTRYALARALEATDRPRALELAGAAREGYASVGPAYRRELDEVDAWIRRVTAETR